MVPLLKWSFKSCRCSLTLNVMFKLSQMSIKALVVKLRIRTEMSGPKSCEALASTCGLHRSLDGCLEFWRSGRSRRVRSRAEKKLKKDESELKRSRLLS